MSVYWPGATLSMENAPSAFERVLRVRDVDERRGRRLDPTGTDVPHDADDFPLFFPRHRGHVNADALTDRVLAGPVLPRGGFCDHRDAGSVLAVR